MPTGREMFGLSRARAAVVAGVLASVVASVAAPGFAYGLAAVPTTTTTTTIDGPRIPPPPAGSTTTLPSTGPTTTTTTTTIPPPPMPAFALPTNAGLQLLQTMQQAKTDLKAAQDGLGPAQAAVAAARKKDAAARRELKKLEATERKTQRQLDDTRTRLRQVAAEAYIHAGDAQLMNAIAGYLSTTSIVDAGS